MTDKPDYRLKSACQLLDDLNTMASGRTDPLTFSTIVGIFLHHKQAQEQLTQTKRLVYATWTLALVTIAIAIITLIIGLG